MDRQKRIVIWVSAVLVVLVTIMGIWSVATGGPRTNTGLMTDGTTLSTPIDDRDWSRGNINAPVTLVEYSDYQCPACGAYYPLVEEVVAAHPEDLRFVVRHFPLPQHRHALSAAYAAEAAGAQGKFWEMHSKIFEGQREWSLASVPEQIFEQYAEELELDMRQFRSDRASRATKDRVERDLASARDSGVNSTPSFYINGQKVLRNPGNLAEFNALIEEAKNAHAE